MEKKKINIRVPPNLKTIRLDSLVPYSKNPRKIQKGVPLVIESMKSFGFNVPITINNLRDRVIIGGHTRYAAAKQMGMEMVPYIELNHLDDMDVRKYRLADNRVADESEWDKNLLRNELAELELNSKLDSEWWKKTGFDDKEIAQLLAGTLQEPKEDFKEVGSNLETPHRCPKCGYAW